MFAVIFINYTRNEMEALHQFVPKIMRSALKGANAATANPVGVPAAVNTTTAVISQTVPAATVTTAPMPTVSKPDEGKTDELTSVLIQNLLARVTLLEDRIEKLDQLLASNKVMQSSIQTVTETFVADANAADADAADAIAADNIAADNIVDTSMTDNIAADNIADNSTEIDTTTTLASTLLDSISSASELFVVKNTPLHTLDDVKTINLLDCTLNDLNNIVEFLTSINHDTANLAFRAKKMKRAKLICALQEIIVS